MDMNEFNKNVIEEFRANAGQLSGDFEGAPMVLVHHVGAKSGTERVTPLVYQANGEEWVIFASKAGAPDNPAWYHNLMANPATQIEVGAEVVDVGVSVAEGEERTKLWEAQKAAMPQFAEYEASTEREIPVLKLSRR